VPRLRPILRCTDDLVENCGELFEKVFPVAELVNAFVVLDFFACRAILTICNDQLSALSDMLIEQLLSELHSYYVVDQARTEDAEDRESADEVLREYLQTAQLPGLPPSILQLNVAAP
jgi:PIF1-like helicase